MDAIRERDVEGEWDLENSMTPVLTKSIRKFLRSELKRWQFEGEWSALTAPLVTSAMADGLTMALGDEFSAGVVRSALTDSLQERGAAVVPSR